MTRALLNVIILLLAIGLTASLLSLPRWQSKRHWLRKIYRTVDEDLGTRKFLSDLRATRRHSLYIALTFGPVILIVASTVFVIIGFIIPASFIIGVPGIIIGVVGIAKRRWAASIVNVIYPHPELSGTMALPSLRIRGRYVHVQFREKKWPIPYHKDDIIFIRLTWTTEAKLVRVRQPDFVTALEQDICRALDLVWHEGMFVVYDYRIEKFIRPRSESYDKFNQHKGPGKLRFEFAVDDSLKVPGELRGEDELAAHSIGDDTTEEIDV